MTDTALTRKNMSVVESLSFPQTIGEFRRDI